MEVLAGGEWLACGQEEGRQTRSPYQVCLSVAALVEVGHDTVDNVGLWRDEIDGVNIWILGTTVLDFLDVCNALVQNVVGMQDIVEQLFGRVVEDQDFPLCILISKGGRRDWRERGWVDVLGPGWCSG